MLLAQRVKDRCVGMVVIDVNHGENPIIAICAQSVPYLSPRFHVTGAQGLELVRIAHGRVVPINSSFKAKLRARRRARRRARLRARPRARLRSLCRHVCTLVVRSLVVIIKIRLIENCKQSTVSIFKHIDKFHFF
jgi:hypothetical protein